MTDQFPTDGLVRVPQIIVFLNLSRSTWWKGVKDGKFPKPIKTLGSGITAWRAQDIRNLIA